MMIGGVGDTGAGGANCGTNPCTAADFLLPWSMRPACSGYLACQVTGNPQDVAIAQGMPSVGGAVLGDTSTDPQTACVTSSGVWDPVNQVCNPQSGLAQYIPWIIGGIALIVIAPPLLESLTGRRRR